MRILVLGYDGYIGWPLTNHLIKEGHELICLDNYSRRRRVNEIGSNSLVGIDLITRNEHLKAFEVPIEDLHLGRDSHSYIEGILSEYEPEVIVHLAEQPSAPWSMKGPYSAAFTQLENVIGTLHLLWAMHKCVPDAHLIKLGTMGEYGTPNCDIPEGRIPEGCIGGNTFKIKAKEDRSYYEVTAPEDGYLKCPMSGLLFPRTANSFYHLSKVHDTHNIEFACRNWGLRSTDIMQGVVYGINLDEAGGVFNSRFDYDQYFGTAINRFCAQAIIEHPLTVYGLGNQRRGFLPLEDSIKCLTLAIENPPAQGEYRTFNQFEDTYSIKDLALITQDAAKSFGLEVRIDHLKNPRNEADEHYYHPVHEKLPNLGYVPNFDIHTGITKLIEAILPYKNNIIREAILPTTEWR